MTIRIDGTLPVAVIVLEGQTEIKSKEVVMSQLTAIEYLQSQANLEAGQFINIADLAAMTKLVAPDGNEYPLSYEIIGNSSRANLEYLNSLKNSLDVKEAAED